EQVENDETLTIGHDRKDTVGNDEQVVIGQDRRHQIGQDDELIIGRNHSISTAGDRTEAVGNDRHDTTAANHCSEIGGNLQQQVQGALRVEAGQRIAHHTRVYEISTADALVLKGPGGTLRIDAAGITLDGIALTLKGPLNKPPGGSGNSLAQASKVVEGAHATCERKIK
ncbi:MAG: bacteriophage T4 gp5 trimerization domain-containing protein, partial [Pseudomonas sp.]|uniref:bacteriophage T4 gp5 trimerisation domain-containing protein n=1 Tax=Pseudomonas sp. TaxID=306 RepID=UPI003D0EE5D8